MQHFTALARMARISPVGICINNTHQLLLKKFFNHHNAIATPIDTVIRRLKLHSSFSTIGRFPLANNILINFGNSLTSIVSTVGFDRKYFAE